MSMDKQDVTYIVLQPSRSSACYNEQEAVRASHLGSGALRHFRTLGLITGQEMEGEWRYSEEEIGQLRRIRRLQHDLGVNLAGVEVILHVLKHLEVVHQALEQERKKHEQ
jgi:MerR family transcriptional regulator, heat shock protein HspR